MLMWRWLPYTTGIIPVHEYTTKLKMFYRAYYTLYDYTGLVRHILVFTRKIAVRYATKSILQARSLMR